MVRSITYHWSDPGFEEAGSLLLKTAATVEGKLVENYTPHRLNLDAALAISFYMDGDQAVGFSTVLKIDLFGNTARILNRFYKKPEYRENHGRVLPETKETVNQQIEAARSEGLDAVFMSREGVSPPAMRFYTRQLDQEWIILPKRYQTCTAHTHSCFQRIAVHPLVSGIEPEWLLNNSMTEDEFRREFSHEL